jgi:hypothetical protein
MEVNVAQENLKEILLEIKNQFINVAIQDETGEWSDEYYIVEGIKEIKSKDVNMTALLLLSPKLSHCVIADLKQVQGIKLNKYLNLNGSLMEELRVKSREPHAIH